MTAAARGAIPPPIGFSSGTLPRAGAAELAAAVRAAGGTGVDLRIGKGHAWQRDGVYAGLAAITAAGVRVFYTGVGWRLGDPYAWPLGDPSGWPVGDPPGWPPAGGGAEQPPAGYPVKVFCAAGADPALVADQLAAADSAGLVPWVETHAGGPAVPDLIHLAEHTGIGVVVDLLGLAEIGGADPGQLRALAPFVRAAQVKGVLRTAAGTRHRPLVPEDLSIVLDLVPLAPLRAVTVESRAGTPEADLAVLAGVLGIPIRPATASPGGTPHDGALHDGTLHDGTAPDGALHDGTAPDGALLTDILPADTPPADTPSPGQEMPR